MSNRFFNPIASFADGDGNPLSGGKLTFYTTGTSTKASTYSDSALTTPNTNPVVLDSAGRLPNDVFLDPTVTYKVVLADGDDIAIWTADPVVDPAANVTAAFTVFAGDPNGSVAGNAGSAGGSGASVVWDSANNLLYVCTTTGTASTAVWTEVASDIGGAFVTSGVISPSSLGANQQNYEPTGLGGASIIRQDADADVNIGGLAGGESGRLIHIHNISSFAITLTDETLASTAANRFSFDGDDVVIPAGEGLSLWYDGTTSRWRASSPVPRAVGGAFVTSGIISPASLGANQQNYSPTGLTAASIIRQDASTDVTIGGLAGGTAGRRIHFHNISSSVITLSNENTNSLSENRFAIGSNLALAAGAGASFWYDDVSSRWRRAD